MGTTLDRAHFPILIQRVVGDHSTAALAGELEAIAEELGSLERRGDRVATIVDLTAAGGSSPLHRRIHAEWAARHEPLLLATTVATAFVAPSRFVAGALTAIFWFKAPPGRHAVFSRMEDAVDWVVREAEKAGLTPPADLRERLRPLRSAS